MDPKWTQNGPKMDTELDTHITHLELDTHTSEDHPTSKIEMRDFTTFASMKVRHSIVHRPNIGEHENVDKEKK